MRLLDESGRRENRFSFPDYAYLRDHTHVFSEVVAAQEEEKFLLGQKTPGMEPEEILGDFVSDNYFAMLGGGADAGRLFTPEENLVAGRDAVVVLSHHFWQRRFGGDTQIVGRSLSLNGKSFVIIGVTSPTFVDSSRNTRHLACHWRCARRCQRSISRRLRRNNENWFGGEQFQWLTVHARLKPGATRE